MKEPLLPKDKQITQLTKEEKDFIKLKKTTFPLMGAVAISNVLYTFLHSFYPLYMATNFPDDWYAFHFALILAIFEIANLFASLIVGSFMGKLRRKRLII
jgi:hypothetical protein